MEGNPYRYTFYTDDGDVECTYDEYLRNEDLRRMVNDENLTRIILGRTLLLYSDKKLRGDKKLSDMCVEFDKRWRANPLQFYAPATVEQEELLNDEEHDVLAVVGANRTGKTTTATVKWLLGPPPAFRTNPKWPIFTQHGIKWHPFRGPLNLAVASYKEGNLRKTIWPTMVQMWTSDDELRSYGKTWRGKGKRPSPAWGHDPHVPLKSGTRIDFFTYEQNQDNYEGGVFNRWLWDEQGKENLFDGADERTRTVKGKHIFSLTPHKVKGRIDTGWGSWIHSMLSGTRRKGHSVRVYGPSGIVPVPDWIYPESEKVKAFEKWEHEPKRLKDNKGLQEGRARLYGEWHKSSGLVLDEWNPELSWIEPLWKYPPPEGYSLYRALDHGINSPTVCLCIAVDRDGNVFVYRAYYSTGKTITQNVEAIIAACGNTRRELSSYGDESTGSIMRSYEEVYERERFHQQVLDGRSFALKDTNLGKPYGWIYRMAGLRVQPASGKFSDHWIPMVQELMHVDAERKHSVTGEKGAPRFYVFSTPENVPFKQELESYAWATPKGDPDVVVERPEKKNDHGPNALGYAVQIPLRYHGNLYGGAGTAVGGELREIGIKPKREPPRDNACGYRRVE